MPGSPGDAALLARANPAARIVPLTLLDHAPDEAEQALKEALASLGLPPDTTGLHLAGFSIGAMTALRLAATRPKAVSRLTLISPAAPLQLGNFLDDMAGKPVFSLAMRRPGLLRLLTSAQGVMARLAPDLMIRALFAKAGPSEQALLAEDGFRAAMNTALRDSFGPHRQIYLAYVQNYVADWRDTLRHVACPVDIWQGTADTWTPPQMAEALRHALGDRATLHRVNGAGHYSTLTRARL